MIRASFNISLQVFHDTEHNLLQLGAEDDTLSSTHRHTHTHIHTKKGGGGISITNDWKKMMMTNNYVLQGQKYTNGAGAVPQWMMGSASDIHVPYRWRVALCQLCPAGAYKNTLHPSELFCYCLAGTLLSLAGLCSIRSDFKQPTTRRRRAF